MSRKRAAASVLAAAAAAVAVSAAAWNAAAGEGCPVDTLPQGAEPVALDPADFTTDIDNPYWPMEPGSRWVYRETAPDGTRQRVVVTVTKRTKVVANGVTARVVHDAVTQGGEKIEVTDDWYAQDCAGNVWYLGEKTAEYDDGKVVSRAGSWEAGVAGAQPGVIVPAQPTVGLRYRQEYLAGEAEDRARVLSVDEQVEVPFGHFDGAMLTKEYTPVEPKALEYKLYAKGVGPVRVYGVSGGGGDEELLSFRK